MFVTLTYCANTAETIKIPKKPCITCRWGRDPPGEWPIFGVVRPIEKIKVSAAVYAAKEIIQSSITAWHVMRPFAQIL